MSTDKKTKKTINISHLCQSCTHNIVNIALNYDIRNWEEQHLVSFSLSFKQTEVIGC